MGSDALDMVLFYTICEDRYSDLGITVFAGRDKFENEHLIKYGWPEDIWFHVDAYSSAHVYLRLPPGTCDMAQMKDKAEAKQKLTSAMDSIPESVLNEMCQLVKNNSIEGCKLAECDIVY